MKDECPPKLLAEALPSGADYRALAAQLREIARQTRLPGARKQLAALAARCDRRADHLDGRCGREND